MPNLDQSLFKTVSEDGAVTVKTAKINAITKSKVVQKVEKFQAPYTATLRNTAEKDHPNFRLDTIMG